MDKEKEISRREFLSGTSAAGLAWATLGTQKKAAPVEAFRSPAGSVIPYSRQRLMESPTQRTLTGEQLSEVAFPLGGIGTGTVALGGRGQLRDWEIFNRPGPGKFLPFSFVALWAREDGGSPALKVVEAPLMPPYRGAGGYSRDCAEGLPRFKAGRFTGAYPFAQIDFEDESLPLAVSLEAFNPFIPLNVDDSSLPVAVFRYDLKSRSGRPIDVALAFSLLNAVGYDGQAALEGRRHAGFGRNLTTFRQEHAAANAISGLDLTSAKYQPDQVGYGSLALLTTIQQVTARTAWPPGDWWDPFQKWYDEFVAKGEMHDDTPPQPSPDGESNYATLAPRLRLLPGEAKSVTFILAWYFPFRENYWNDEKEVKGQKLRNYYGTRFQNAWEIASHVVGRLDELEAKTRAFSDVFYSTSVPGYVLEAVSSQASILRTNTCMLLEGKQFFAFEGCDDNAGCCPLNCTHVWNYEQALAFLYPELERSMRHTDFTYNMRSDNSMAFRTLVPVGRAQWNFRPAADGQMGCILKLYREWQISGDDGFLRQHWPAAKRALEFAWTHWDANRDGLMEGQQHNTYDIEFYGPNPMMSTLYLGALRAGELMAGAIGDHSAAAAYRDVREKGIRNLEQLWNGEFYIQKIPPIDQAHPMEKYAAPDWFSKAVQDGQIRYQFGDGCLSDQLLGVWFTRVIGLDPGWRDERMRQALTSIYRYNFKNGFYDHPNTQRIYALNDEKGLLLCSWPKGGRPKLPFVYSDEVWTGIEFQVAAHMIYEGLLEEGLAIVKGVTERYDGWRRNPWNEVECGNHYARALASWSVLLALSGFEFSAQVQRLGFAPRTQAADFRTFFAAGSAWGGFRSWREEATQIFRLEVKYGTLPLQILDLSPADAGQQFAVRKLIGPQDQPLSGETLETLNGGKVRLHLERTVVVHSGQSLTVQLAVRA
jgi:uncharacterized protein (DUF608 family)